MERKEAKWMKEREQFGTNEVNLLAELRTVKEHSSKTNREIKQKVKEAIEEQLEA